jgi:serine/threonine-protein kinase
VLALIGTGGMGRVYKVRNIISNREEAMKILLPDFAKDADLAARFMSEIRTLAGLEHPNIAQLRTAFQVENQFVMVMEFVEGTTLDKLAPQLQGSFDTMLDYATQVLGALSYAHGRGVTHRDIKPSNIMITSHGIVKLMDFGIAKSTTDMNLTRPGTTMGSIYYMSPEQVRGGTIDARSDIYSFGVTLYELITGRKPFQSETSYTVLNAQVNEMPPAPSLANPAVPQALSDIVMRAMAKDPGQRFQTADEFRNALSTLRQKHTVPAAAAVPATQPVPQPGFTPVAVTGTPAAQRPAKSHRALWVTMGALATVLLLVAAGFALPRFYKMFAAQKSGAIDSGAKTTTTASPAQQNAPTLPTEQASNAEASPSSSVPGNDLLESSVGSGSAGTAKPVASASSSGKKQQNAGGNGTGSSAPQGSTGTDVPANQDVSVPSAVQAPAGPSPQEIRQAHDRFSDFDARAQSVSAGVQQIRSQQQAMGMDIRGDILTTITRMNNDMRDADRALGQNDIATANSYLERAGQEIEKLEKFLGR